MAVAEVVGDDVHVRHLERLPLGTPYPQVIERITALAGELPSASLVVDATGVGRAVLDHMAELEPVAVTITGGRLTSYDGRMWRVPKKALLRPLVAATESGRLKGGPKGYVKRKPFSESYRPSSGGSRSEGTLPSKVLASTMIW